jgi:transcriptional regulator with XRE-family HTH domain
MEVTKMLKALRQTLHLTHAEMARLGGISVPALRNLEAGRSSPTLATVQGLLRPLGLKLAIIPRPDQ